MALGRHAPAKALLSYSILSVRYTPKLGRRCYAANQNL